MGQGALNYQGVKSGIKLNDIIEDFKYVYKGQTIKAGDLVNYIEGLASMKDYGESIDTQLSTETNSSKAISAVQLDNNRVFIAHQYGSNYYLYGLVVTVNGASIEMGTDTALQTVSYSGSYISAVLLDNGNVFIANSYNTAYPLYGMICAIDGNTVTRLANHAITGSNYTGYCAISAVKLKDGSVFIAHGKDSSNVQLYGIIVKVSGTEVSDISIGTDTQLSSATYSGYRISTSLLSNGDIFVAHCQTKNSFYLYSIVCSVSGTTITKGSDTQLNTSTYTGSSISICPLPSGKVLVVHSYSSNFYLYGTIVTVNGTSITKNTIIAINSALKQTGTQISTILLPNGNVFITHTHTESSYYLYGIIINVDNTTIITGTDTLLNDGHYAGHRHSSLLLSNGIIFTIYTISSNYQLGAQVFGIDEENNIPTNHIIIPEYETQVTQALENSFNAVALSSGVGAPEYVEATKTDNLIPTSWAVVTDKTKYSSNGYILEASSTVSSTYPANYACDNDVSTFWSSVGGTENWLKLTVPKPIKITKMKTYIQCSNSYFTSAIIQGSNDNSKWDDLYTLSTSQTQLEEIVLQNSDEYMYYRILVKSTDTANAFVYEWQVSEYIEQIPSTEHNEQVKIAKLPKLLSSLPIGTLVKDVNSTFLGEPVVWKIADKNHEGYPNNSVTLITERSVTMRAFDANEPSNSDSGRQEWGNNRYSLSNIRQWLNSDSGAGQWYTAQHSADTPPNSSYTTVNAYSDKVGFLNGFSQQFKDILLETTLTTSLNTATDGGGSENTVDKIFLASCTEVGGRLENNVAEGTPLPIFNQQKDRIAYCTTSAISESNYTSDPANNTTGHTWWLRTPQYDSGRYARTMTYDGYYAAGAPYLGYMGVRPLCNIPSSLKVSSEPDEDGCYILVLGGEN